MALIKCVECEKEISDHAEMCPHCGKSFSVKNKAPKLFLVLSGIFLPIFGIIMIVYGAMVHNSTGDHFVFASASRYGGDAYTGIQNAAAITANNVRSFGEVYLDTTGMILIIIGSFLVVLGIIELICGITYKTRKK